MRSAFLVLFVGTLLTSATPYLASAGERGTDYVNRIDLQRKSSDKTSVVIHGYVSNRSHVKTKLMDDKYQTPHFSK